MPYYYKKSSVVIAEQFTDNKPCQGVYGGFEGERKCVACIPGDSPHEITGPAVVMMSGLVMPVKTGDWIVDEGDGKHFHRIPDEIFKASYEPCEQQVSEVVAKNRSYPMS